ncbi:MAG: hypothetical protein ACR2HF_11825 [Methylococcaceae bacterium]
MSNSDKSTQPPSFINDLLLQWTDAVKQKSNNLKQADQADMTVPSLPHKLPDIAFTRGVLRESDWIIGSDSHPINVTAPPIPLGLFPVPFFGQLKVRKIPGKKPVLANGKRIAIAGQTVCESKISHLGPITLIPALSAFTITGGSPRPMATIKPGKRKIRINGKTILTSADTVKSSCGGGPSKLKITTSSGNVKSG